MATTKKHIRICVHTGDPSSGVFSQLASRQLCEPHVWVDVCYFLVSLTCKGCCCFFWRGRRRSIDVCIFASFYKFKHVDEFDAKFYVSFEMFTIGLVFLVSHVLIHMTCICTSKNSGFFLYFSFCLMIFLLSSFGICSMFDFFTVFHFSFLCQQLAKRFGEPARKDSFDIRKTRRENCPKNKHKKTKSLGNNKIMWIFFTYKNNEIIFSARQFPKKNAKRNVQK